MPTAYAKASRRFAIIMAYRATSRVILPLKHPMFPLRIKISWKTEVGPSIGSNVENLYVCGEEYIGETSRTFRERFKEHLKEPFPIHNCSCITGNTTIQDNLKIIERKDHDIAITNKESIYLRVNNITLNKSIGKFHLHHRWNRVLFNTPELKMSGHAQGTPPIGHAKSTRSNTPMHIFTSSMQHVQRTPLSEHGP